MEKYPHQFLIPTNNRGIVPEIIAKEKRLQINISNKYRCTIQHKISPKAFKYIKIALHYQISSN